MRARTVIIACPKCKSRYQVKDDAKAEKVRCKKCQEMIDVRSATAVDTRAAAAKTVVTASAGAAAPADASKTILTPPPDAGKTVLTPSPSAARTVVTLVPDQSQAHVPTVVNRPAGEPPPQELEDLVGKDLGGYHVLRKLGQGGMGAVYEARQVALDRSVAIKVLPADLAANKTFVLRFTREALSVAKLNHTNVIQIYDVGKTEGTYFFSMEFVRGTTLQRMIEKDGVMDPVTAVGYIMQAARGLEYAHRHNIVHRDIKPDNIMVNEDGVAKVADLGLAKDVKQEEASMTMAGVGMGTPYYMSPEQATDAKNVDARADIYSLGCTLFQLLTGSVPYDGGSAFEIITKHVSEPIVLPHRRNARVPEELSEIVGRMMAKKREDRYASMSEVIAAMEKYLGVDYARTGFHPSEAQITQLQEHARTVGAIRNNSAARMARLGIAGIVALLTLIGVLWGGWRFTVGVLEYGLVAGLGIAAFIGFTRKTYGYRRVRQLIFRNRLGDWIAMAITAIVVVVMIVLLKLTLATVLALIFGAATVAGYYFGLRRPLFAKQDAAVEETKKFLRDFRRKGMPEEAIHLFVCQHGGTEGELLCEDLYGYEAVVAARTRLPPQDLARRPFGIRMREWFIGRIDRAEAKRMQKKVARTPAAAPAAIAPAASGPTAAVGVPSRATVPGSPTMPMTPLPAAPVPATAAVSTQTAEEYLQRLEQPRGSALDAIREVARFFIGRKGRLAIGAVLVLLAVLAHTGKVDSVALKSWNYGVFALALTATGLTRGRTFLTGLALACIVAGPVALFAGDGFLSQTAAKFAEQMPVLQKGLDLCGPHKESIGALTITAFAGAFFALLGLVIQLIFGDW